MAYSDFIAASLGCDLIFSLPDISYCVEFLRASYISWLLGLGWKAPCTFCADRVWQFIHGLSTQSFLERQRVVGDDLFLSSL